TRYDEILAFVDSVAPNVGNPTSLRLLRADALFSSASPSPVSIASANAPPDTAKRAAALREYAAVRQADPTNVQAFYAPAVRLAIRRVRAPNLTARSCVDDSTRRSSRFSPSHG